MYRKGLLVVTGVDKMTTFSYSYSTPGFSNFQFSYSLVTKTNIGFTKRVLVLVN